MTTKTIEAQIKSLELQLAILKAQIQKEGSVAKPKTFADLEGILSSDPPLSEEEIESAKYCFEWDGKLER